MQTVKAIALVGFYRGDLVEPGQIIELPGAEFAELRSFNKVELAPDQTPQPQSPLTAEDSPLVTPKRKK